MIYGHVFCHKCIYSTIYINVPGSVSTFILLSINAHAEELRSKFVTHKGKKELTVEVTGVHSRCEADFGGVAQAMAALLKENVGISRH